MEYIEADNFIPMKITDDVPEKHLIMMFPNTYVFYRVIAASYCDYHCEFHQKKSLNDLSESEKWLKSFKTFLVEVGPVPEDIDRAH